MTQNQKTLALSIGVASFLLLALLVGFKVGGVGGTDTPVVAVAAPAPASADAQPALESIRVHLEVMKVQIRDARQVIAPLVTAGAATDIRRAIRDLDSARGHVDDALAFIAAHPDAAATPAPPTTATIPVNSRAASGQYASAMTSIRNAFEQLGQTQGGTLGDNRDQLIADLQQAAADINAGAELMGRGPGVTYEAVPAIDTVFRQPKAAANAAVALIRSVGSDAAFSGKNHPGLMPNLTLLETAAQTVIDDKGADAAASEHLAMQLRQTANESIAFVNIIANRARETPQDQRKAHQLALQLHALGDL